MTVVYAYFRYMFNRENYKSFAYYFSGPVDVQLSGEDPDVALDDMGNSVERQENEFQRQSAYTLEEEPPTSHGEDFLPDMKEIKKGKRSAWKKGSIACLLLFLGFIIFVVALAVIAMSITSAVATNFYSKDLSGRLVALVILAVTAAIAITMTIMGIVGLSKKKKNAMYAAAAVMIVLAIIQPIILGVSIRISTDDEYQITNSLIDTYGYAKAQQPKFLDIWSATEYGLSCCGVNGPEDYRTAQIPYYFPPDVSITCCDTYDPSLSLYVQEREREICKARKQYYAEGCKGDVLRMFKDTAKVITDIVVALIVLEVVYAIIGICYTKLSKGGEETTRRTYYEKDVEKEDKHKKEDKIKINDKKDDKKDDKPKKDDKKDSPTKK